MSNDAVIDNHIDVTRMKPQSIQMWKKIVLGMVLLALAAGISGAIFFYGMYSKVLVVSRFKGPSPTPTSSPVPNTFNKGQTHTSLLMGYGGGTHQGGLLTDTMMMVIIDPSSKNVTLISLPRDLWVDLPVSSDAMSGWKINAAYAIGSDDKSYKYKPEKFTGPAGGGELAKYAVNQATGLEVNNFVTLNFAGFRKSIDVLGGVDVNVEKTFDDYLYPIEGAEDDPCGRTPEELQMYATMAASITEKVFTCRYEHLHFDKGITLMDGTTALKYVRSRHSAQDGNDFGRTARQRNLILAVKDQVFRLDFFPKIIPFVSSLTEDLKTDFTLADMQDFLRYTDELRGYKITSTALSNENVLTIGRSLDGQSIVTSREGVGEWDVVHTWVRDELMRLRNPMTATGASSATSSAEASGSAAISN